MHLVADQLMSSRKSEKEKRLCAVRLLSSRHEPDHRGLSWTHRHLWTIGLPLLHALLANVARA